MAIDREIKLTIIATSGGRGVKDVINDIEKVEKVAKRIGGMGDFMRGFSHTLRFAGGNLGRFMWALDSVIHLFQSGASTAARLGAAIGFAAYSVGLVVRAFMGLVNIATKILGFYVNLFMSIAEAAAKAAGEILGVFGRMFQGMANMGASAVRELALSFVQLSRESLDAFVELEQGSLRAWANISNQGEKGFRETMGAVRDVAWDTGRSMTEVASALYEPLSSGFYKVADSIMVTRAAADLAIAGYTSMEATTGALLTILENFNLTADDSAVIVSKIWVAMAEGRGTMELWARQLHMVGAVAAAAGISLEHILAVTAMATKPMGATGRVFTGVRQFITSLTAGSGVADKNQGRFARAAGMDSLIAENEGGEIQLDKTIMRIRKAVKTQQAYGKRPFKTLKEMFPRIRGTQIIASLLGWDQKKKLWTPDKDIQDFFKLFTDEEMTMDRLKKAVDKVRGSFGFWIKMMETRGQILRSFFGELGVSIATPIGRNMINRLEPIFKMMKDLFDADWFKDIETRMKGVVDAFAALGIQKTVLGWIEDGLRGIHRELPEIITGFKEWVQVFGPSVWNQLTTSTDNWGKALTAVGGALKRIFGYFGTKLGPLLPNANEHRMLPMGKESYEMAGVGPDPTAWDTIIQFIGTDIPEAIERLNNVDFEGIFERWGAKVTMWGKLFVDAMLHATHIFLQASSVIIPAAAKVMNLFAQLPRVLLPNLEIFKKLGIGDEKKIDAAILAIKNISSLGKTGDALAEEFAVWLESQRANLPLPKSGIPGLFQQIQNRTATRPPGEGGPAGSPTAMNKGGRTGGISMMRERMTELREALKQADAALLENQHEFWEGMKRIKEEKDNTRRKAEAIASVER